MLPIEVKAGKSYRTHASLDDLLAVDDYGLRQAFVLSNANVSKSADGHVLYLPAYYLMFMDHAGLPVDAVVDSPVLTERDIVFKSDMNPAGRPSAMSADSAAVFLI